MDAKVKTLLGMIIVVIVVAIVEIFIWQFYGLNPISDSVFQTVVKIKSKPKENTLQIANPASVYCQQNDGTLEIRTGKDGGQTGYCKFFDGSECEEWKYYRGECKVIND